MKLTDGCRVIRAAAKALGIRTDVAHPARVYDYLLGGKDNFAADRELAEANLKILPQTLDSARANRKFQVRAVQFLRDSGIRQFLDVGTGLPTSPNTHEIAQADHPGIRVVYVDNDHFKSGCTHESDWEGFGGVCFRTQIAQAVKSI